MPPGTPDHAPGTNKAEATAKPGFTCAVRGSAQTISITSTPGFQVGYGTVYPDGEVHKEWNSAGVGSIPPGGTFVFSWTVPTTAPLGRARTDVSVAGRENSQDYSRFIQVYWTIATSC